MTHPLPRCARLALRLGLLVGSVLLAGCLPPAGSASGAPGRLYVANGLDGTVTRLDAGSGRAYGPPLPAGTAPAQVVAGPGAALLVRAAGGAHEPGAAAPLTHIASAAPGGGAVRAIPLEPGATGALLAGDGGTLAVLAYRTPAPVGAEDGACRLAVIDAPTGGLDRVHPLPPDVCGPHDSVRSLALARGAAGPTAYLGIWRWPGPAADPDAAGHGQIVGLRTDTGAVVAITSLAGTPERLAVAGVPDGVGGAGPWLLCVEEVPGPRHAARSPDDAPPERRHLLAIDPVAGRPEAVYPVAAPLRALAVAPDGRHAYLLAALDGPRSVLAHVDLAAGTIRHLVTVPGLSLDVAVSHNRIYLPRADRDALLVLDRAHGRVVETIPVGRRPLGVALSA